MSEPSVADGTEVPSSEPTEAPAPEAPATDFQAQATEFKNRFAGSQRKLTETQQERDAAIAEAAELRRWKAEQERASMTELERLQAERDEAKSDAAAARAEAARERLARKFPLAVEFYGDEPLPSEEKLAALQERLDGGEPEPEPMIDPNNPRKDTTPPPPADPLASADRWLRSTLEGI